MILSDLNQNIVVLQVFALNPDGSEKVDVTSGTVRAYSVSGGSESVVLAIVPLVRVGSTNIWRYEWHPFGLPVGQYTAEFVLTDSRGIVTKVGEDVIVRDIATQTTVSDVQSRLILAQADLSTVLAVETGRWKIEANQMIFYETDGTTPLLTFDLFDDIGLPNMDRVFERKPA
jgi:hypothetical protein